MKLVWSGVMLLVASAALIDYVQSSIEGVSGPVADILQGLQDKVANLEMNEKKQKSDFTEALKQIQAAQLFVEERIRSDGNSGVKQARSMLHGTEAFFESTHIGKGAASMHDHSNSNDILGLGESVIVMNGVEFRTRHNDAHIRRQSTTDKTFNAIEQIEFPAVPTEVLSQPTVQDQVKEMQLWLKAFKDQDYSVRDYRKYFKPILCYFEGFWTLDKHLTEPFVARRHSFEAKTWEQLRQQIIYTSYTGGKNVKENFSFLPRKITSINSTTGEPTYGQWNYNILCHPTSMDIPTKYLRLQDDWAYRERTHKTMEAVSMERSARYRLSKYDKPQYVPYSLMDEIMSEIAGKDNVPGMLNEEALGEIFYNAAVKGTVPLNTGYYHRMYRSGTEDASGRVKINRAFSDDQLYFAETTQERIAPVEFRFCKDARTCWDRSSRYSYAIPFELVYLTPLILWNPYDIEVHDSPKTPRLGGRTGAMTKAKALNGASTYMNYYLTPPALFSNVSDTEHDPADTVGGVLAVLDKNSNLRKTVASGTRIVLPEIPGIGNVRLRYPLFALHVEGSTIWKELQAAKGKLTEALENSKKSNLFHIEMFATSIPELHSHEFFMTGNEYFSVVRGGVVSLTTSVENGHSHDLEIVYDADKDRLVIKTCDDETICWDRHKPFLKIVTKPF